VNDKRPVNLDIGTIALPITANTSILHRVSGVFLVAGVALLFWLLGTSLDGPEGFAQAKACLASFWGKLSMWAVLVGLIYHSAAGVKHLFMDAGVGESMEGGETGAKLVFAVSAVLAVLAGLWIW
jgi:succinate dehydrogenase / fumarate reductase cytochrome b subunit